VNVPLDLLRFNISVYQMIGISGKMLCVATDPRLDQASTPEHLIAMAKHTVPPIHRAGWPFVAGGLGLALLGARVPALRYLGLAAGGFSAFFFRNPNRAIPTDPRLLVAPADGEICLLDEAVPPEELGFDYPMRRVSIFLSLLDVHVQRAPLAGTVVSVEHVPGEFLTADLPEASTRNERNSVRLRTETGTEIGVVQIAGMAARRIVCEAKPGDELTHGQVYGLIRFGSRVDLYLPPSIELHTWVGQRVLGGQSVLGKLR
jgi:phosphatidylserine decarboxylase